MARKEIMKRSGPYLHRDRIGVCKATQNGGISLSKGVVNEEISALCQRRFQIKHLCCRASPYLWAPSAACLTIRCISFVRSIVQDKHEQYTEEEGSTCPHRRRYTVCDQEEQRLLHLHKVKQDGVSAVPAQMLDPPQMKIIATPVVQQRLNKTVNRMRFTKETDCRSSIQRIKATGTTADLRRLCQRN